MPPYIIGAEKIPQRLIRGNFLAKTRKSELKSGAPSPPPLKTGAMDERIGFLLRIAQIAVMKDLSKALQPLGLRPSEMAVIRLIGNNPGVNQGQLSDALYILRPNMVIMIDHLQQLGWVARVSNPGNRRSNLLTLTPAGKKLFAKSEAADSRHSLRCRKAVGELAVPALTAALRRLAQLP